MRESLATLGLGAVAVACCAAGPVIFAAVSGASLAAILGWGAALVVVVATVAFALARRARLHHRDGP